ncbi:riboflavin synthase [Candidatus Vallotia lariciata]|uniref:riboflavin synthase n=1 Tax=Candidatus Vallotia laricis TaxID=2018052 RepID=UPI001D01CEEE|nr:riboflavin synthase [Candidatus Vallotia lariciata]UDG83235.1 Riboflavin synthase [Candidatus Vallotia lariciata]
MFTGIVTAIGRIELITPIDSSCIKGGLRLSISAGILDLSDVRLGDSIAVQGACLTVIGKKAAHFNVDVSRETLNCTAGLTQPGDVNLEKALRVDQRLSGHMVSGHIDGMGQVSLFDPAGESYVLCIVAPSSLAKYFAHKGSVTLNGVSLTINTVKDLGDGCELSLNLIPYTIQMTTLRHLRVGDTLNIEVDIISRYIERMLSAYQDSYKSLNLSNSKV